MAVLCAGSLCCAANTAYDVDAAKRQYRRNMATIGPRAHEAFMTEMPENCCVIVNAFEQTGAFQDMRSIVVQVEATSSDTRLKRDEARLLAWNDNERYAFKPKEFLLCQHSRKNGMERIVACIHFEVPKCCPSSLLHFEFGPKWTLLGLDTWLGSYQARTRHDIKPQAKKGHRENTAYDQPTEMWARTRSASSSDWVDLPSDTLNDEDICALGHVAESVGANVQVAKESLNVLSVWTDDSTRNLHVCVACASHEEALIALEVDGSIMPPMSRFVNHLAPNMVMVHMTFDSGADSRLFLVCPGREKTAVERERAEDVSRALATLPRATNASSVPRNEDKLCVLCSTHPPNATFVHGTTGHKVCCIECALKITNPSFAPPPALCPVCRKPIDRVIKTFE